MKTKIYKAKNKKRNTASSNTKKGQRGQSDAIKIGSVVDLFCGAGGLSHGFKQEGFEIAAGIDVDENCRYAYEFNNRAPFLRVDVHGLSGKQVTKLFAPKAPTILVGCAPCQPFSVYNQKNADPQWQLLEQFARIITETKPLVVSMENVPTLIRFRKGKVFNDFVGQLKANGYHVFWKVVRAADYGVPQTRSRLVLLASRLGPISLRSPTHEKNHITVKSAIGKLPSLKAGAIDPVDPLHRCSGLSETNLQRMRSSRVGGTWRDWDRKLVTKCHRKQTGRGYSSVYGRMAWKGPSPTITTQFFGFGNGRFGHPSQNRALSLREGAILQSFPEDYRFVEPGRPIHFKTLGRMIGNAVPVKLGRAIAQSIKQHFREHA